MSGTFSNQGCRTSYDLLLPSNSNAGIVWIIYLMNEHIFHQFNFPMILSTFPFNFIPTIKFPSVTSLPNIVKSPKASFATSCQTTYIQIKAGTHIPVKV